MKYNDNGTYKDIFVKVCDTMPIGAIVEYSGATIPAGWTDIGNNKIQKISQAVTTDYQVNGIYTTSQSQAYSCNYINDLFNSIGDDYSTLEQRCGTWTDGKPLYRKVFIKDITNVNAQVIGYVDNVDNIFITDKSTTIIKTSSSYYYVPVSTYETSSNFSKFYVEKTLSNNSAQINWIGNSTTGTLIVVVEYTKTTD